ncbi:ribose 5-phosphate isomerase B [bacterium]|nr:ribose 5-phosphate isomerase B [bacterium]
MDLFPNLLPIAIGADHAGFNLKTDLIRFLKTEGFTVLDVGTNDESSCDYPDYAHALAKAIAANKAARGVLICGSGIGISIAANRHPEIRAALVRSPEEATLARQHNDANVLVLGARFTNNDIAKTCLQAFLSTDFEGGRHAKRVEKINPKT